MGFLGLGDEAVPRLVDSRRCRPRRVKREREMRKLRVFSEEMK